MTLSVIGNYSMPVEIGAQLFGDFAGLRDPQPLPIPWIRIIWRNKGRITQDTLILRVLDTGILRIMHIAKFDHEVPIWESALILFHSNSPIRGTEGKGDCQGGGVTREGEHGRGRARDAGGGVTAREGGSRGGEGGHPEIATDGLG